MSSTLLFAISYAFLDSVHTLGHRSASVKVSASLRRYGTTAPIKSIDQSRSAEREGIEGTIARAVKGCGVSHARYVGLAKVHLRHLLGTEALNFLRVGEWLAGSAAGSAPRTPVSKLMTSQVAA
jgi:hypothetical protein